MWILPFGVLRAQNAPDYTPETLRHALGSFVAA
jgi:hypothetical protein